MKATLSPVILSAAKDLLLVVSSQCGPEILRCAQDDMRQGCPGWLLL